MSFKTYFPYLFDTAEFINTKAILKRFTSLTLQHIASIRYMYLLHVHCALLIETSGSGYIIVYNIGKTIYKKYHDKCTTNNCIN